MFLECKTDKHSTMMSKLTTQSKNQGKPFKLKFLQGKRRGQGRLNIITEVGSKVRIGQIVETDSEYNFTEEDLSTDNISEEESLEEDAICEGESEEISGTMADFK